MNRELGKYRGQRKDNGEMVYGYYLVIDSYHLIIQPDAKISFNGIYGELGSFGEISTSGDKWPCEVIPETVGEFTGEYDKERSRFFPHGKEIWEGDTVKASIYQGEDPQILPVYYDKGAFWIDYKDSESDRVPVGCFIGSLEIIGNDEESCETKS